MWRMFHRTGHKGLPSHRSWSNHLGSILIQEWPAPIHLQVHRVQLARPLAHRRCRELMVHLVRFLARCLHLGLLVTLPPRLLLHGLPK